MDRPRFHLAIAVGNLEAANAFYHGLLGCPRGRASERWIDFNFFGHQLTTHLDESLDPTRRPSTHNPVDGDNVPIPHFGAILPWSEWEQLSAVLQRAQLPTLIGPRIRFKGEVGEQGTLFVQDPSGNVLEFKTFRDDRSVFASS